MAVFYPPPLKYNILKYLLKFWPPPMCTCMNFLVGGKVGFWREGSSAGLAVVLGLVGVEALHVGLQGGQVAKLLRTVAAPERFRVQPVARGH